MNSIKRLRQLWNCLLNLLLAAPIYVNTGCHARLVNHGAEKIDSDVVKFYEDKGLKVIPGSRDPTYGYTSHNPIVTGSILGLTEVESTRYSLMALRDLAGRTFSIERVGSAGPGPDGHMLDIYEMLSLGGGVKHMLYIDMYHTNTGAGITIPPMNMILLR